MFRKLLSLEEAKEVLEQNFSPKPLGVERSSLSEAHDRVSPKTLLLQLMYPHSTGQLSTVTQ